MEPKKKFFVSHPEILGECEALFLQGPVAKGQRVPQPLASPKHEVKQTNPHERGDEAKRTCHWS